jgi:cell division transport system permease protein
VLLVLAGVVALSGLALRGVVAQQAQSAAVLHVYLRDDAARSPVNELHRSLMQDPQVASVGYTSKQQALREARQRPGLGSMASASGSNPFPASFDVQVKQLQNVGVVASLAERSPAVDPNMPTSYDAGAYQTVVTGLSWFAIGGAVFLLLLGIGTIALTQNSIKSAIFSRRAEIRVMQLVGARRWMVRGPFIIEGAVIGATAGAIASAVIGAAGGSALRAAAAQSQTLAPGVGTATVALASIGLLVAGIVLGALCSLFSLHRHLER